MTPQKVKDIVMSIISIVSPDAEMSKVEGDVPLRDQLDMDSMDLLDIVMELRKRYRIEVPKEDYPRLATLNSCVSYLVPHFRAVGADAAVG